MKKRTVLLPLTFLFGSLVICGLVVGLFLLAGGNISEEPLLPEEQTTQPEPPKGQGRVVIIDAGHGGEDGGAIGVTGLVEKDLNLDLAARQAIGDANPDAIFVSLHANTFPEEIYHGLQVWYSPNCEKSAALAEAVRCEVVGALQPDNHRQCKPAGSNIFLLHKLQIPAVLVECGFLSNAAECRALEDPAYRDQLAHALYKGICAYYEGDAQ